MMHKEFNRSCPHFFKKAILRILLFTIFTGSYLMAADIRPIRDDIGFCWEPQQIERLIDFLKTTDKEDLTFSNMVAGISPHDDYLYAGRVFYPLFKNIKAKEVVIFGVTHSTVRKKIGDPQNKLIFDEYDLWKGPYQKVRISKLREFLKTHLKKEHVIISNEAHRLEHSIEAFIPFLQYFNRDIAITPIMVTGMPLPLMDTISGELSRLISEYIKKNHLKIGSDILFLISADANHYGKAFDNVVFGEDQMAHQRGTDSDLMITNQFLTGEITQKKISGLTGKLWGKTYKDYSDRVWCGKFSIPFGLLTITKVIKNIYQKDLYGKLIIYTDSYTEGVLPIKKPGYGITAPFSLKHWVGFFSSVYYIK
jgi:AmmeMemoRadiSam system protein B